MNSKIYEALKTSYSNLGLSDKVLKAHAEMLANLGFVTDENLASVIKGQEATLKEFQSSADKDRAAKAKAEQELANLHEQLKSKQGGDNEQPEKKDTELTPESISKLIKDELARVVVPIQEQLTRKEAEEERHARATKILTKAKELQIPEWRINEGFNIAEDADEEAINTYLSGVKKNITTAGLEQKEAFPLSTSKNFINEEAKRFVNGLPSI